MSLIEYFEELQQKVKQAGISLLRAEGYDREAAILDAADLFIIPDGYYHFGHYQLNLSPDDTVIAKNDPSIPSLLIDRIVVISNGNLEDQNGNLTEIKASDVHIGIKI